MTNEVEMIVGDRGPDHVTTDGIKLYLDTKLGMLGLLNRHIKDLGLKNTVAFLAVLPNNEMEYVLFKDGKPFHVSQRLEDIDACVETIKLAK